MNKETLKEALLLNSKLLHDTEDLVTWSELMIQRTNLLNMLLECLEKEAA